MPQDVYTFGRPTVSIHDACIMEFSAVAKKRGPLHTCHGMHMFGLPTSWPSAPYANMPQMRLVPDMPKMDSPP